MKKVQRSHSYFKPKEVSQTSDFGSVHVEDNNNRPFLDENNPRLVNSIVMETKLSESASERYFSYHPAQKDQLDHSSSEINFNSLKPPRSALRYISNQQNPMPLSHRLGDVEYLKTQLQIKQKEIEQYQHMLASKSQEISLISSEVSRRIQNDHSDKNLFIKEINSKDVEIEKLKQYIEIFQSQKKSFTVLIQDKDTQIKTLRERLSQIDVQKKKIESYEARSRESAEMLRDIEAEMMSYRTQNITKDKIINENKTQIEALQVKSNEYLAKIKEIEKTILAFKERGIDQDAQLRKANNDVSHWQHEYFKARKEAERLPELQIKLNTLKSTLQQLEERNQSLSASNQQMRLASMSYDKNISKLAETENQLHQLRQKLREAEQVNSSQELKMKTNTKLQQMYNQLKIAHDQVLLKLQSAQKEAKTLSNSLSEQQIAKQSLQEELAEANGTITRMRQSSDSVDSIYQEKKKISQQLLQKINNEEKMQNKINSLENKVNSLSNQINKLRSTVDAKDLQINDYHKKIAELRSEIQSSSETERAMEAEIHELQLKLQHKENQMAEQFEVVKNQMQSEEKLREESEQALLQLKLQLTTVKSQLSNIQEDCAELSKDHESMKLKLSRLEYQLKAEIEQKERLQAIKESLLKEAEIISKSVERMFEQRQSM